MSLDDTTLARPVAATATVPNQARWSLVASDPNIARQQLYPIVAAGNGLLFAYGGDSGVGVLRSDDQGASWTPLTADYTPRDLAAGLRFGDFMFLIGGEGKSDVYVSQNGQHWYPRVTDAPWGPRSAHAVAGLGSNLYLMGGIRAQNAQGDVWVASAGGTDWTLLNDKAFDARCFCAAAAFNGQLVLMGGSGTKPAPFAEVLVSNDGRTWQTRQSPWTGRYGAAAVVVGDTLYLIGGIGAGGEVLNEVWTTTDLVSWNQIGGPPVALSQFGAGAIGEQVVVLGGVAGGQPSPQVWGYVPHDGWIEIAETQEAGFLRYPTLSRLGDTSLALNGQPQAPVTTSKYERIWTPVPTANLPYRRSAASAVFGGAVWVTGGEAAPGFSTNEVRSSADGVRWQTQAPAMWAGRKQHAMVAFEDTLFVIGGDVSGQGILSDVYSLCEGDLWCQERADPFPGRCAAVAVSFKGNIWLLGGRGPNGPYAEALRREPDLSWTTFPAPWAARYGLAAGVMGGRLYVSLGQGRNGPLTDTWVSDDGKTWTPVAGPPGPALNDDMGWLVHDDALLVVGGSIPDGQPNFIVRRFLPPG